jgi:Outer membrane protein beta-barrel domain
MHNFTTLVAGLTSASALSFAMPYAADAQMYVSAQLGMASTDWARGEPLNGRIDDDAEAYGIDVGVEFGKRWAFEFGAYGYGGFDASGTPCAAGTVCSNDVVNITGNEITILKAALAPRFNIGQVRLFGTFGYYQATIETNLDGPEAKSKDNGAVLGLGARWYFREPWSVSLQATRFDDNLRQLMFGVGWGLRADRAAE